MSTIADATRAASAARVSTDGASRDPVDAAGAGAGGAATGAAAVAAVAALGTAPSTRQSVATCGGGLVSVRRLVLCAGRLNTTGGPGAGGAAAAGGATVVAALLGGGAAEDTPGPCGCPCGCDAGCFCCMPWSVCGWPCCVAVGDGALAAVICNGAVAGVPSTGSPSRPVCVATIVCAPAAAGTVKLNATAPPRSGAPDHRGEPVDRSRWSCTALPAGLKPLPEPLTVEPLAALAVYSAMCAWAGAAMTVTARIAAARAPTAAAARRTHVDRQGYNK